MFVLTGFVSGFAGSWLTVYAVSLPCKPSRLARLAIPMSKQLIGVCPGTFTTSPKKTEQLRILNLLHNHS